MPKWGLLLIIALFGAIVYVYATQRAQNKALREQMQERITAMQTRMDSVVAETDSTFAAYRLHNTTEAARLKKMDSAILGYQNDIRSLKTSVNALKRERNEIQSQLDSLTAAISLPEL